VIRPLATFIHVLDAARTAGTLSRTVLVLSRQLDNAHLLAASEGARADRAELRVAELEAALQDWREASGELVAEQPAADPLPDLTDAGEAPIPLVLTDSAREIEIQRDRADALQRALQACEVDLAKERSAHAKAWELCCEARTERDHAARSAGAHIATIEELRARLDLALSAVHRPAPAEPTPIDLLCQCGHRAGAHRSAGWCGAVDCGDVCPCLQFRAAEQIPGVAAASPYAIWSAEYDAVEAARATAGTDDPPATKPSERPAKETGR
jgi:hypothetical protein